MLNKEGRPIIANPLFGLAGVIVALLIYIFFVPFDFVFKDDSGIVYTQRGVSVVTNFEKNSEKIEGGEAVYGDDASVYYYGETKEKIAFTKPYGKFKWNMALLAMKNLVTLNWEREDFVMEMNARPR